LLRIPYFAYGSNLPEGQLLSRAPDAVADCKATLDGWRLTFRGVADIEPVEGDRTVFGAIWWISASDVKSLDRYEGAPFYYEQRIVVVGTPGGARKAMTYVMVDPETKRGLPSPSYFGTIARGFREWDLPISQLQLALEETRAAHEALGIDRYVPDGPKRLRAVTSRMGRIRSVDPRRMTPATIRELELEKRSERRRELRRVG
jgi:hypothetical protein